VLVAPVNQDICSAQACDTCMHGACAGGCMSCVSESQSGPLAVKCVLGAGMIMLASCELQAVSISLSVISPSLGAPPAVHTHHCQPST
jgi:hypothetical protein